MSINKQSPTEPHLKVFHDRSELVYETGAAQIFPEGKLSKAAQKRLKEIRAAFDSGFLPNLIETCQKPDAELGQLPPSQLTLLTTLVESLTSEVGRAIVGLTVLQLCLKTIAPTQSIRLHKGGNSYGETRFSWQEGLPMRSLDKSYITPVLRRYDLLRTNADGVMMTRSLAENYPYSQLYKAAIRGARQEWLTLVDLLEQGEMDAESALRHLLALLLNKSDRFQKSAANTVTQIKSVIASQPPAESIIEFMDNFIDASDYSARLLEIAMHSLFQAKAEWNLLDGDLKPLSQMRSANKKHGNIGDVEVTVHGSSFEIIEAWDAKYGKPYLRDELEELNEKLRDHLETEIVGFVVDQAPTMKSEISRRMQEIAEIHDVQVFIIDFRSWATEHLSLVDDDIDPLSWDWLLAFTESLCQMRREQAPIDEPADAWVKNLGEFATRWLTSD